jgi:hypothetical protein
MGTREPWDASICSYGISLVVAGFVAALVSPRHFWIVPLGVYSGQVAFAAAFSPAGSLWPLGLGVGLAYSTLAVAGSTLALIVSKAVGK